MINAPGVSSKSLEGRSLLRPAAACRPQELVILDAESRIGAGAKWQELSDARRLSRCRYGQAADAGGDRGLAPTPQRGRSLAENPLTRGGARPWAWRANDGPEG